LRRVPLRLSPSSSQTNPAAINDRRPPCLAIRNQQRAPASVVSRAARADVNVHLLCFRNESRPRARPSNPRPGATTKHAASIASERARALVCSAPEGTDARAPEKKHAIMASGGAAGSSPSAGSVVVIVGLSGKTLQLDVEPGTRSVG
jgi:hypothetical protein